MNALGHPSIGVLSHLAFLQNKVEDRICDVCHKAKQTRIPFPVGHELADSVFDLVHVDVWGPYRVASLSGAKYMFTIIDYKSRAVWLYLMNK